MNIQTRPRFACLTAFMKNQSGATAIEYALIAALISVVVVGALTGIGTSLNDNFFSNVNDGLDGG